MLTGVWKKTKYTGIEEILWPNIVNVEKQVIEVSSLRNFEKFFNMLMECTKGL